MDLSTYNFTLSKSYARLKSIADRDFDLTSGGLTPERLANYKAEACGLHLLYGTELVNDEILKALNDLVEESQALEKMEKLQSGEVMNYIKGFPSDNRPVLHTATRDFFDNPQKGEKASQAAQLAKKETEKLKRFLDSIEHENLFDDLIVVGIGGSELGPKAHYYGLEHLLKKGRKVHFVCSLDPDTAALSLKGVNLKRALVLSISKSGTTEETVTNEKLLRSRFEKEGVNSKNHFISVTVEGTPMDNKNEYLEVFHLWDWVGGRFSTSSMGGGVLLSFAFGFDVYMEFLKGAHEMDKSALNRDLKQNLPLLSAILGVWNRNFLNIPSLAMVPYSSALFRYPAHVQQVDMESNGKHIDREGHFVNFQTGPLIFGEPGTNAQHSFYQLIHQGSDKVALEFIGFKHSQMKEDFLYQQTTSQEKLLSHLFAQSIALAVGQKNENPNKDFQGNRPNHILLGNELTPFVLGALLAYYEHKVAFQGFIWNINSFDQEGVQLGKVLAAKILERTAAHSGRIKNGSSPYPLGDAYLKCLDSIG